MSVTLAKPYNTVPPQDEAASLNSELFCPSRLSQKRTRWGFPLTADLSVLLSHSAQNPCQPKHSVETKYLCQRPMLLFQPLPFAFLCL